MRTVRIDEITSDWLLANVAGVAEHFRALGEAQGRESASAEHSAAVEAARLAGVASGQAEAAQAAREAGAAAERERILGIQRAALPGQEQIAQKLIEDPAVSVADAGLRFLEAEGAQRRAALDALRRTEPKNPPSPSNGTEPRPTNQAAADIKAAGDYAQKAGALK